jgi:hypothetical protein
VAASQWNSLDWGYIGRNLEQLCDLSEKFASVPKLDQLRTELELALTKRKRKRT